MKNPIVKGKPLQTGNGSRNQTFVHADSSRGKGGFLPRLALSIFILFISFMSFDAGAQNAPSSNIDGPLKAFVDSSIVITSEIASDAQPDVSYKLADNTSGAFIISRTPLQYNSSTGLSQQTVLVNPGSTIGSFNIQLIVTSAAGNCESSKSVTVVHAH